MDITIRDIVDAYAKYFTKTYKFIIFSNRDILIYIQIVRYKDILDVLEEFHNGK